MRNRIVINADTLITIKATDLMDGTQPTDFHWFAEVDESMVVLNKDGDEWKGTLPASQSQHLPPHQNAIVEVLGIGKVEWPYGGHGKPFKDFDVSLNPRLYLGSQYEYTLVYNGNPGAPVWSSWDGMVVMTWDDPHMILTIEYDPLTGGGAPDPPIEQEKIWWEYDEEEGIWLETDHDGIRVLEKFMDEEAPKAYQKICVPVQYA